MSARWWTFLVWALAAASALAWGLKVFVRPQPAPPQAQLAEPAGALRGDLTRLLGVDPAPVVTAVAPEPAADERFDLVGVVSPRSAQAAREGLALIAVDGKPARAYRVGAVVEGANVLQSVSARGATLGPRNGEPVINLSLAPAAPAAKGVLPSAAPRGSPALPVRPGMRPPTAPTGLTPLPVQPSISADDGEDTPPPTAAPETGPGNRPHLR